MGCNTREENAAELAAEEKMREERQCFLDAADAAIEAHTKGLAIEGNDEIKLWHLIASLLEWCDQKNIDFDYQVELVREHFRSCGC